jgi:hypothetical protein
MLLPTLSSGSPMLVRSADAPTTGISPSFCTPCVLNHRICGLPFSPSLETCGSTTPTCTPCLPFINKKVCIGPAGPQILDC